MSSRTEHVVGYYIKRAGEADACFTGLSTMPRERGQKTQIQILYPTKETHWTSLIRAAAKVMLCQQRCSHMKAGVVKLAAPVGEAARPAWVRGSDRAGPQKGTSPNVCVSQQHGQPACSSCKALWEPEEGGRTSPPSLPLPLALCLALLIGRCSAQLTVL